MNNGYSICFNKWALDKSIKNELNLLLIISSLCAEKGFCYASNKYLAELFNETEQSISNKIRKLERLNYIIIEYKKRGCEVVSRYIRLKNFYIDDIKNIISTIEQNFKENNISINNISNNNKESSIINNTTRERFKKPTLEEIERYVAEKELDVDAQEFYNYFEAGDWHDSKGNKVKRWKQKILTWNKYATPKPKSTLREIEKGVFEI